jgi:hypothetical protein
MAGSAQAVNLDLTNAFAFDTSFVGVSPEGLAYNPNTDTLIVSTDAGFEMAFYEFNLDGTLTNPSDPVLFTLPGGNWRGLDFINSRGTLLASQETGAVREYNLDGTLADGGISFNVPSIGIGDEIDAEGVVLHSNGNVYVADDGNELLREFVFQGTEWVETNNAVFPLGTRSINMDDFDDPSGIEELPGTGNLLVHDDSSGGNMGFIWEVDLLGNLVMRSNAAVVTAAVPGCGGGCVDGEALAYDDANDVFFIAYENDQLIISYPRIAPEPSAAILIALGFGVALRRRA